MQKIALPKEKDLQLLFITAFVMGFKAYVPTHKGLEIVLHTGEKLVATLPADYNAADFAGIFEVLQENCIEYVVLNECEYRAGKDEDYDSFRLLIPQHPVMAGDNVYAYINCWLKGLFMRDIAGIKNGELGLVFYGFDAFNPNKLAELASFRADPENFPGVAQKNLATIGNEVSFVMRLT